MAMQSRIKWTPILVFLGIIGSGVGLKVAHDKGFLSPTQSQSVVPLAADLPEAGVSNQSQESVPVFPLPSNTLANVSGPQVRMEVMAWNAQMGLAFANGGPKTTSGSLMEAHKVNLSIERQDDCSKMQTDLISFAKALKSNPQPTDGVQFVIVMGDGSAAWIEGVRPELEKLGPEYMAEVVGSTGYSRGEDKFMGLPEWKQNPKTSRGALVAGVLRDGDWNEELKWSHDNDILNNPDEKTYDPDAINWVAANDFLDAANKYITNVCEDRPVVHAGKRTGETKHVCVNGVVTWVPGDVNVAQQKGGLVSIVSTKEYAYQMPATIIGVKKWNLANRSVVEGMLEAIFEGGDQVKAYPQALTRAADASAAIYKEQNGAYWEKYYKGVVEADKTGAEVSLGGSIANNLSDNLVLYGLNPGSANLFAATYKIFGDIVVQQYPKLVSSYPSVNTILNTSYVSDIASHSKNIGAATMPKFTGAQLTNVVSKRAWSINFDTGKATFSPDTVTQLTELKNGLLVADDLAIEIHGYTDNTGDVDNNLTLSQARANAVKNWLSNQSSSSFPSERFAIVKGHGSNDAVASNETETGRAKNRRVTVVLGTTN
jgi:OmpA-OmpF porin, OOP family